MSARSLRITLIGFTLAGLGIASYLTFIHYSGIKVICTAGESCTKVETSVYSELAGVPVALLGLLGYSAILGLLLAPENETTRFAMTALTLVGFAFSAYLTYRELFSIHAICEWCATSAAILTLMAPLSVWRFMRGTPGQNAGGKPRLGSSAQASTA
ncbi:MAG TPA: vitamin K epoxide reductase family protein [Solirubrobacteraceae bacterium]|nr:vitamin K epoxide reductase family protein [Solirubrobacteraceae bacterium]